MSIRLIVRGLFDALTAGFVPASGGGTANFLRADGTWAAPVAASAAAYDTILTPGTVTFGATFDNWNVGTLGQNTLIQYTTDGAPPGSTSRAVRGLAGGSVGKKVTLMNVNPSTAAGSGLFQHEDAAATAGNKFHNTGSSAASGGPCGCVDYWHDGTIWRQTGST